MNKIPVFFLFLLCTACGSAPDENPVKAAHLQTFVADSAGWPDSFGFGHSADTAVIARLDIDVRPDGKGLPPGAGTATEGRFIYAAKCIGCHGGPGVAAGVKYSAPVLINNPDSPRIKTIGNYWPYASTVFDYIRRAMPYNAPGSLNNHEVYALTAYLLHENGLLDSATVLTAAVLPGIIMPALKRYVTDDRHGGPEIK